MSRWIKKTIGEICDLGKGEVQTGPFGSQLHQSDYREEGIPVVMPKDIIDGKIDESSIARVADNHVERLSRHKLSLGDIIYGRRGDIGRQALVRQNNVGWLCGSGCLRISLGNGQLDPKFLHFYLQLPEVISWIENQAVGATMLNLNTKILRSTPVYFPNDIYEQKKLASILSAYDDLIENNRRRIALLEKMVEEIYREWFVRLRFPGYEQVKFHKGVLEGWEVKTIGSLCVKVTDGSHASPDYVPGGMYMASVKDMHFNGFSLDSMKTISEEDFRKLEKADCRPLKNDVLIAKDGSYLKHSFVWNHNLEVVILSSIAILRPNINKILPYFFSLTLKQESTKSMMSGYVSGSALPRIILNDFKKMKLMVPPLKVLKEFEDIISSIYTKIRLTDDKNLNLKQTRDRLLTRLISGKLSVEDLDIQFPPSMVEERLS